MKSITTKFFLGLFCLTLLNGVANSQTLLEENFNYVAGTALSTNGWTLTAANTTNIINVSNGGLTYEGYVGSGVGNGVSLTTTGQDIYKGFMPQNSGTVYAALLVNVSAAQVGDYFFHFTQGLISSNAFYGRLFARLANNGKLTFGVSKSSVSATIPAVYSDSVYNLNTTYLIVVKYKFMAGSTTDDEVSLFVSASPTLPMNEPSPTVGPVTTTQTDATDLDIVNLRQGGATIAPTSTVDGFRVATSWGEAVKTIYYDDPAKLVVKNIEAAVTMDGKLDEGDWNGAPSLLFGNGAHLKKQAGDQTATGGFDIKATFGVNGTDYHLPNKDSSWTRVKFLRKGTDLFIGLQSNDKSIGKFDWEGDGLFVKIKNSAGEDKEYKLYWQNIGLNKDTIVYEGQVLNSGAGAGFLPVGSTVNDTMDVDNGYSAELRVKLGSLGYTGATGSIQLAMAIFDPDGYKHPMNSWDSARGSYYKSWWGSEWGGTYRTLELMPEIVKYDDPAKLVVKNIEAAVTMDGKLDEGDWNGAPSLLFGNGAHLKKQAGDQTATGGFDIKATFGVNGTDYHLPNKDSSWTRVKFLRKGTDLFIGLQSNDKSIGKFDWEGDGLFVKIKNSAGEDKEYKLYWQNIGLNKDTIVYEGQVLNSGAGAGFLPVGSTVNDTMDVDNGYSAELRVKLGSLGYTGATGSIQLAMAIFDPDGYKHPMNSWDSARGSYYKSWWGSEWGGTYRTLELQTEYDNPDTVVSNIAASVITVDGKLEESDWSTANTLIFGPSNAPKTGNEKTVTAGFDIKATFGVNGTDYHLPYKDTSYTKVKFLAKGNELYIGIQSPDKSIGKFDWEGDGLFIKIKNSAGEDKEYKLYWQNTGLNKDTIKYEEQVLNSGAGAGFLPAGSTVNDTMNVDNGYSAELKIKLNSLGFAPTASVLNLKVAMTIFDADGYQHPMAAWDSARGSYYKSWWGSEWGGVYKNISIPKTTGVHDAEEIPMTFALNQNYPNPFNPSTVINFAVPEQSNVTISVYDVIGREVATLAKGVYTAGRYDIVFNARNLASGMYIYRMTGVSVKNNANIFTSTKKLMLLK